MTRARPRTSVRAESPRADSPEARRSRALALAPFLERMHAAHHRTERIGIDPLSHARAFDAPEDRELAAFVASALAYGAVAQIDRSLRSVFDRLGGRPARFVRRASPAKLLSVLDGFRHRFHGAREVAALLHGIGQMLRAEGSIEGFWARASERAGLDPRGPDGDTAPGALSARAAAFLAAARTLDYEAFFPDGIASDALDRRGRPVPPPMLHLLPEADGPSACKRLHLFLRWCVRPADGVDLGLWRFERPAALEFPVDTHVHRIATYLGATRRAGADAGCRRDVTEFFRHVDPADPVRFDFALCRMGIARECPRREERARCAACELSPECLRRKAMDSPA